MTIHDDTPLHPSIIAMVSLAANIAANHPKKGLCQLERLRGHGVAEDQIAMVIDISRHIRDEAAQVLDAAFDVEARPICVSPGPTLAAESEGACGCSPTAKGNACC